MSASSIAVIPLVLGLIALGCVVVGIYLIVSSRRTVGSGPRCGHCQYNLTGSTANRCPECGRLFIEVGVVMQASRTSRVRRWVGIGLLATMVPLFCLETGSVVALLARGTSRRAQAFAQSTAARQQAQNMALFVAVVILVPVACVVVGIYLIATSRRSVGSGPRCGHCQYNLTGSTANRCPECGRLFIEAGVVTNPVTSLRKRRRIGIALIMLPLVPMTVGLVTSLVFRAQRASIEADRARAMAAQARQAAMLARQFSLGHGARLSGPSTAPAVNHDGKDDDW